MKIRLTILLLTLLELHCFSQDTFTSRKGTKFFPGHLDVAITIDHTMMRYELFNHWYSWSYIELRQMTIPLDSLKEFNLKNDSIKIILQQGKVKLVDKKYRLSRKVKHRDLCTSPSNMRKISWACEKAYKYNGIEHYELYEREDLNLEEEEFKKKVLMTLDQKTKQ